MTAPSNATLFARTLCGVAAAFVLAGGAAAQDLPRSPACRTAVAALDEAESALAATATAPSAGAAELERQRAATLRLQPLRRRVADACLGGMTTSPPPSQHTLVVPPPPPARPAAAAPRMPTMTPPSPVTVPAPPPTVMLGSCNGSVCTASDGSTLTRVGPNVTGPRGLCRVQGLFVVCP